MFLSKNWMPPASIVAFDAGAATVESAAATMRVAATDAGNIVARTTMALVVRMGSSRTLTLWGIGLTL
jgi:hypothetical protein